MKRPHSGAIGQPRDSMSPEARWCRSRRTDDALVLHHLCEDHRGAIVQWRSGPEALRRSMQQAAERARVAALSRTLQRTSVRWCAVRGKSEWYQPWHIAVRTDTAWQPADHLRGHMTNTDEGQLADDRDSRAKAKRTACRREECSLALAQSALSVGPRSLQEALTHVCTGDAELRRMATQELSVCFEGGGNARSGGSAASSSHEEWTQAAGTTRGIAAGDVHSCLTWQRVLWWATGAHSVPDVDITLPESDLAMELEDILDEGSSSAEG